MGILRHRERDEQHVLLSEHLIGRGSRCQLKLDDPLVSGAHAMVRWRRNGWEVHDLASRNGTWVNGHKLASDERRAIAKGTALAFGTPTESFEMLDDAAPIARAVSDRGEVREALEQHLLPLPDDDAPVLTVFERDGQWMVETQDGEQRPVHDGEVLVIGSTRWTLELPLVIDSTQRRDKLSVWLRELTLCFSVSREQERIRLRLHHLGGDIELSPRVHMEMLLRLAETWREDEGHGVAADERGWLYVSDLLSRLRIHSDAHGRNLLYQHIFQARQQAAQAGVVDAAQLVQRRTTIAVEGTGRVGQIRIGAAQVAIESVKPTAPNDDKINGDNTGDNDGDNTGDNDGDSEPDV